MNIPKGYKLVPVEPTEAMNNAGDMDYSWNVAKIYRAMLAAAPSPPQPIYDEAKERELFECWAMSHHRKAGNWFKPDDQMLRLDHNNEYYVRWLEHDWVVWLARAQSRAKAGEVGDE